MTDKVILERYAEFANAIVVSAMREHRTYLRKLSRNENDRNAQIKFDELEFFFYSDWFGILTNLGPDYLIDGLQKKVQYDSSRIFKSNKTDCYKD